MGFKKYIEEEFTITEQLSGAEIAKELGITRQAVSNTLKRALSKMHDNVMKDMPEFDAFEAAVAMMVALEVDQEKDTKDFFKLFPPAKRKEIENAAKKRMPGKK